MFQLCLMEIKAAFLSKRYGFSVQYLMIFQYLPSCHLIVLSLGQKQLHIFSKIYCSGINVKGR